jgi:hypothetical protein
MSEAPDLSRRYGPVGESGAWRQVSEAYYWDRLDEADEIVRRLGAGAHGIGGQWMRLIEAEAITRKSSSVSRINDWLELELIEEECPPMGELGAEIEASCLGVARRFVWTPGPMVRVMVMAQHADTPWTPGRHGFCPRQCQGCIPAASNCKLASQDILNPVAVRQPLSKASGRIALAGFQDIGKMLRIGAEPHVRNAKIRPQQIARLDHLGPVQHSCDPLPLNRD